MDLVLRVQELDQDANFMTSTFETDVLIVGGGPAGSSTALSLLKYSNLEVALIEQGALNNLRVGEQVNASIFDLLSYLGISKTDLDQNSVLPGYDSLAAWGSSNISSRHSVFSTQVDNFQLDREVFDLFLLKKASENGALIFPRTKAIEFKNNETFWLVNVKHETKGDFVIKTKYLVDATGRQSSVCRKIGAQFTKFDDLVAVGSFLHFKDKKVLEQEILLETVEEGWWYYAALPNNRVVVSLFTDSIIVKEKQIQRTECWMELLLKTNHVKRKMKNTVTHEKLWVRNAFSHFTDTSDTFNFLAVGDAAASFDPISSFGIGFAISSACHAAKAILDHEINDHALTEYQRSINEIFSNYMQNKHLFYNKEQRWKDSYFWKNRT